MKKIICVLLCAFSFVFAFNAHAFEKGSGWYVAPKISLTGAMTGYDIYNINSGSRLLGVETTGPYGMSYGIAIGKDFSKTGLHDINLEFEYFHSSIDENLNYTYSQRIEAFLGNIYYNLMLNSNFFLTTSASIGFAMHGVNEGFQNMNFYNEKLEPAFVMGLGTGFLYNINENWGVDLHARFFTIFGGGSGTDIFGEGYYLSNVFSMPMQAVLGVRYYF